MVERGRSPGAKGTAFPHAQRPQRQGPQQQIKGGQSFAGGKPVVGGKPAVGAKGAPGSKPGFGGKGGPGGKPPGAPRHRLTNTSKFVAPAPVPAAGAAPSTRSASSAPAAPAVAAAGIRVSKLLAERGLCSRREADEYIAQGWVFVDGERITELGVRAAADAQITLAPEAKSRQDERVTILLHKPVGYVSGLPEDGYQPAVVLIRPENYAPAPGDAKFKPGHLKGLAPAGRLDIDSTGMLVLTQDGRIARQLIGEDSAIEKEYLVRVEGQLAGNGLQLLRHGLSLDDKPLKPALVEWLNEDQLRFVLREGKKRQIRRMCELVGLTVVGLKRVRMGRVMLGDLALGKWRYLRKDERF